MFESSSVALLLVAASEFGNGHLKHTVSGIVSRFLSRGCQYFSTYFHVIGQKRSVKMSEVGNEVISGLVSEIK